MRLQSLRMVNGLPLGGTCRRKTATKVTKSPSGKELMQLRVLILFLLLLLLMMLMIMLMKKLKVSFLQTWSSMISMDTCMRLCLEVRAPKMEEGKGGSLWSQTGQVQSGWCHETSHFFKVM